MESKEIIIVFGLGRRLKELSASGYLDKFKIIAYCDNDVNKQDHDYNDIPIISPNRICEYKCDAIYITSKQYELEIRRQLIDQCGIPVEKIKTFNIQGEKYSNEIAYWKTIFQAEKGKFQNSRYKSLMLAIAQETDDMFMKDKVVADFGCGPRGSLAWTDKPAVKIGIDVLVGEYMDKFGSELNKHNMIYVTSSETRIPIPDAFVDYLYTINALDHVDNLEQMSNEILRIMKTGGKLLGSFNLNEPATECEPQMLTEELLREKFLRHFTIEMYYLAYPGVKNVYENFSSGNWMQELPDNRPAILWVKGTKM